MISNQPTIFHSVITEPTNEEPLNEKVNFFIDKENQIAPLAKKVMLLDSVVKTLSNIDLTKNKVWVIGRTRDEMTRYGITVKTVPESPNKAIINVFKYKSLMTLQLQEAPKYREFLILVLSNAITDGTFHSTDLDLRSSSEFGVSETDPNFIPLYMDFEKKHRGIRIP